MRRRRNPSLHRSKLIRKSFFTDSMRSLSSIKNAAFEQMTRDVVILEMTVTLRRIQDQMAPAACPIRTVSFVLFFLFPYRSSFMSFSLRTFLYLRHPVCLFQDPSGGDQRSAGRGEEDGE